MTWMLPKKFDLDVAEVLSKNQRVIDTAIACTRLFIVMSLYTGRKSLSFLIDWMICLLVMTMLPRGVSGVSIDLFVQELYVFVQELHVFVQELHVFVQELHVFVQELHVRLPCDDSFAAHIPLISRISANKYSNTATR